MGCLPSSAFFYVLQPDEELHSFPIGAHGMEGKFLNHMLLEQVVIGLQTMPIHLEFVSGSQAFDLDCTIRKNISNNKGSNPLRF